MEEDDDNHTIFAIKEKVKENKICGSYLNNFKALDISQQMWVSERRAVMKQGTNV